MSRSSRQLILSAHDGITSTISGAWAPLVAYKFVSTFELAVSERDHAGLFWPLALKWCGMLILQGSDSGEDGGCGNMIYKNESMEVVRQFLRVV